MGSFNIKRNDTARKFTDQFLVDGTPVNLQGAAVSLIFRPAGGVPIKRTATITNASEGRVEYHLIAADVAASGVFQLEWEVVFQSGDQLTFPSSGSYRLTIEKDLA
jgi:hypothetical protein